MAVLLGLALGSFAGMLVYRLPRGLALDKPGSFCPGCRTPIGWWSNIPLVGFLLQRGRCANCGKRIHWRYPLSELLCALLALFAWYAFGASPEAIAALVFCAALVALALIDFEHGLLPDRLTLGLLWVGLAYSLAPKSGGGSVPALLPFPGPGQAIAGAIAGYAFLWLFNRAWRILRKRDGLGLGDCKLLAAMGAWLGFNGLPLVMVPAAVAGALSGLLLIALGRASLSQPIPFGPFLAAGGVFALFLGPNVALLPGWTGP
ncbi:MAG: A24 family peptidase [Gammaproteobacteria bacterium]|nr:A24 family peptidase [Gammaproteobacteria bacterium]